MLPSAESASLCRRRSSFFVPAGALGLSALFFGERLTQAQIWSAALLLFGAFLAMNVKTTPAPAALEEV